MNGWHYDWVDELSPEVYAVLVEELAKEPTT